MQNVANPGFYCYLQLCNGTPEEHNGSHNTFASEADTQERQSREHVNECHKATDGYIVNNQRITTLKSDKDGRLKTLNFVINDAAYLDAILTCGERVDGSSLFSFIEAGSSDLYVLPRFNTAFLDPFAQIPTLSMLCSYFNKDGEPLESSPEYTLKKACEAFTEVTGMQFQAMGELEYYVIAPDSGLFPTDNQRGYHESAPYAKFNAFRTQCMAYIAQAGGRIKYGHSEVGNFTIDGYVYEQNEIEFLPVDACRAADQLVVAKWIIRNLANEYGYNITFAPKITAGKAGSGLHIHMRIMENGVNKMLSADGTLSDTARKAIAGMMKLAPSITAFGNTNPTSYFRLVPHQEAPTNVCWGDRNRSVLVRVPLVGLQKAICAVLLIHWRVRATTIQRKSKQWRCVRPMDRQMYIF